MDYDATEIPTAYDKGRDHGPEILSLWMDAIASHVEADSVHRILDLGCGTGRFSEALAARFDAEVIGVDPSKKMLEQARNKQLDSRVRYEIGPAEAIPLPNQSVDFIFMSMCFHHFADPELAARECRRVLRNKGKAFLRTGTREHISSYPYVAFFPESVPIMNEVLPDYALIRGAFESGGFCIVTSKVITQTIAPNLLTYAEKLSTGADSVLARLNQKEFESGLSALRTHASIVGDQPVVEPIDLFVFEKAEGE